MKSLLIFLLLFTYGCGNTQVTSQPTNNAFSIHLKEFAIKSEGFISEARLNDLIKIKFHTYPKDSRVVGTCHCKIFGKNIIWISKKWWNNSLTSDYERLMVVFHELGHCLLSRRHTIEPTEKESYSFWEWVEKWMFKLGIYIPKGYLKDGCPASIMHPYVLEDSCTVEHYDYYMDELFWRK